MSSLLVGKFAVVTDGSSGHTFFSCDVSKVGYCLYNSYIIYCAFYAGTRGLCSSGIHSQLYQGLTCNCCKLCWNYSGNFGQSNYAATKAGVVAFSKSVAKEFAKKDIRINTVLPGFIRTPMTAAMPDSILAKICAEIPMGRIGEGEEIADAILFLASDMAKYVTGATLEVTGGLYM
uniref:Estradiol 17-beta-dehydrogenase 8-like n=1 Tax=Heterorhabditis bacteriophora TaxID=37862 RepID=A0A1I7XCU4_HETBA